MGSGCSSSLVGASLAVGRFDGSDMMPVGVELSLGLSKSLETSRLDEHCVLERRKSAKISELVKILATWTIY